MRHIDLNRQLMGVEDFLFGVGKVLQTRGGQQVEITKINAGNLPFDETQSLLEWAQSVNLFELGQIVEQLAAIGNNLQTIINVDNNESNINIVAGLETELNSIYTNLVNILNVNSNETNINKVATNETNINKVATNELNINKVATNETNINKVATNELNINKVADIDSKITILADDIIVLNSLYTNLAAIQTNADNITAIANVHNNMTGLNSIVSQVIPHMTEILLVDDLAIQVANDRADVASMKLAVETIYDTFDDRFLGTKTVDPTVDNDGNPLLDGALYFNTSSNVLKVYDLGSQVWVTIPQLYLSALLDVILTSITTGDILTWNGSKWVNTRTPKFDSIQLNGGTGTTGTASWNTGELTYDIILNSNTTLQVGQEELVYCKNNSASVIANGRPVMASGTNGSSGNILIDLHDGTKASAKRIVGISTEDFSGNGNGFVTRNGKVRGINTSGSQYGETWSNGDILYVKSTGNLTKVVPQDAELKMPIAFVINAHATNGTLYVRTNALDENMDKDLIATKADLNNPKFTNNISLGNTTLSSWASLKVVEVASGIFFGTNGTSAITGSNCYYDGNWKYKVDGSAGLQLVNQGSHQFRVAPAGLANALITWETVADLNTAGLNAKSGTTALPGFGFLGDTDTGIYNPGANQLDLVSGGVSKVKVKQSGAELDTTPSEGDNSLKLATTAFINNQNIGNGTKSFNGFGGSGFKNHIINGNFDVWQRGTSFTGLTNGTYSSDRWVVYDSASDINYNVIRNAGVFNTGYGATYSFNSGTGIRSVIQFIENVTRFKVGSNVTVSFEAYTNSTPYTIAVAIQGIKGVWAPATREVTSNIELTNTKTKYSVTLQIPDWTSLGIDWAHIEDTKLALKFNLGADTNGLDFILGSVQLEEGSVATPFEQRPIGLELSLCQRYYRKSFNTNVTPSNAGSSNTVNDRSNAITTTAPHRTQLPSNINTLSIPFGVEMRITPTIQRYGNSSGYWFFKASATSGFSEHIYISATTKGLIIDNEITNDINVFVVGHYTADAEL